MSKERKSTKETKKKPMTNLKEKRANRRAKHAEKKNFTVF